LRRGLVLAALLAGCAPGPGLESDWERAHRQEGWEEERVALPAYPRAADLVEFAVPDVGQFRFFIDAASLSLGEDGVVRYALVARSPGGAENASFEGLRCETGEYRVYAVGHAEDRSWARSKGNWQAILASGARWRSALQRQYFCRQPVRDREEGLRRLREGGWRPGF
jgi:hypothetical protein